jgi:hypothetical protein
VHPSAAQRISAQGSKDFTETQPRQEVQTVSEREQRVLDMSPAALVTCDVFSNRDDALPACRADVMSERKANVGIIGRPGVARAQEHVQCHTVCAPQMAGLGHLWQKYA